MSTQSSSQSEMQELNKQMVVEPFAKINYWNMPGGEKEVKVYFKIEKRVEGTRTGLAIDASASMQSAFGRALLGTASKSDIADYTKRGLIKERRQDGAVYRAWTQEAIDDMIRRGVFSYSKNVVQPEAREMSAYLASFDVNGSTTVIYWAAGDGKQIEVVGDLSLDECKVAEFASPKQFGNSTHLVPAIQYFADRFKDDAWGIYVFITDGALDDLALVKQYSTQLARDIEAGTRNDLKLVLIGVGDEINEDHLDALDDLETGTDLDLWDAMLAKEISDVAEIFREAVGENVPVVDRDGIIRDPDGNIIKDFRDSFLPSVMHFTLPAGSDTFVLEIGGNIVAQQTIKG